MKSILYGHMVLVMFFSYQIYPDEGHFLHSKAMRRHLGQSLLHFFEECFRRSDNTFEDDQEEKNKVQG